MTPSSVRALLSTILLMLNLCRGHRSSEQDKATYIVHMAKSEMPQGFADHRRWYAASLRSVSPSADAIYTYDTVVHGFSARLTAAEARRMGAQAGILSVQPEVRYELHTTRSPEFLGLDRSEVLLPASSALGEVIVGMIDSGVWPESRSFADEALGPVPGGWKGVCEVGKGFNSSSCNRKLIGARFFSKGYEAVNGPIDESRESKSPRDDRGHGTHTASTAAGSAVAGASLYGYASGTARGMAAQARVAEYKACWKGGCLSSDLTAAMDKAVEDGVHVLSMSIGGSVSEFYKDIIAIGTFGATERGVLVSCSAGNSGPGPGSLANVAPWITTVGAGTLDRSFPASVVLGNGDKFSGVSIHGGGGSGSGSDPASPLVSAANASNTTDGNLCLAGSLIPERVKGKIVVCDRGGNRALKGLVVRDAGGAGMILANTASQGEELVTEAHLLPAVAVGHTAGELIKKYISDSPDPRGSLGFGGTQLGVRPAPVVAAFSSRGPNPVAPGVLKPDLIAPGVNILAGWSGADGPTGLSADSRRVQFNIISGTSMSCPHVSGLAALLKAAHPEWSPAAVRSALMTTAYTTDKSGAAVEDSATKTPATPFAYGAGHVDPVSALDPGLVYDAGIEDYYDFLCALKYSSAQIKAIARRDVLCNSNKTYSVGNLNYPSFAVTLHAPSRTGPAGVNRGETAAGMVKHTRTLTNVGPAGTYRVSVSSPELLKAVKVTVEPEVLSFGEVNEKKRYAVTFSGNSAPSGKAARFGSLQWSDGKRVVRSQIAVSWT